jgi:hypothetical protein
MITPMSPGIREQYEFVPQAILKKSPAFFIARGIAFQKQLDDLNFYQVAELSLDAIPFALMRHEGAPVDETEVYLPDTVPLRSVPAVIGQILKELDLPSSIVAWQRETADSPF